MANDTELINSLIWSKKELSLSKFLKDYPLPQIVHVVDGFKSKTEETSIPAEQILVLQEKLSTRKLVGTDSFGRQVAIALSCPTKVHVCPLKNKNTPYKLEDFKTIFPKVHYVRAKTGGIMSESDDVEAFPRNCTVKAGDLLQIMKLDKKKKAILCQNVDTKQELTLSYKCPALFTPLLDYRKYTLSEVVAQYGLPARVSFDHISTCPQAVKNSEQSWDNALKGLSKVVLIKEVTEVKVLATTEGGVSGIKHCLSLPTNLPIQCTVAERFTTNGGKYDDVLRTLHTKFNGKKLAEFERVNVFQDINVIKTYYLTDSVIEATVSRLQPEPEQSTSVKAITPPLISPKPKRRPKKNSGLLEESKTTLGPPNHLSRSLPDVGTNIVESLRVHPKDTMTAAKSYNEISRTRPEDSKTITKGNNAPSRESSEYSTNASDKTSRRCPFVFPPEVKIPNDDGDADYINTDKVEDCTNASEVSYVNFHSLTPNSPNHLLQTRADDCTTVAEDCTTVVLDDSYVEMRTFKFADRGMNKFWAYDQNDIDNTSEDYLDMFPSRETPPFPGNLNAQFLSKLETQKQWIEGNSTNKASSTQPKTTSHEYEEVNVRPGWLSNFKKTEFAVPSLTRDSPQSYSDYVIPLISPNVQQNPQVTKKFEARKVNKKQEDKHSGSYENIEIKFERSSECAQNEQLKASSNTTDTNENANVQEFLDKATSPTEQVPKLSRCNAVRVQTNEIAVSTTNWGSNNNQDNFGVAPLAVSKIAANIESKIRPKEVANHPAQVGQNPEGKITKNDALAENTSDNLGGKFCGKPEGNTLKPNPRISQIPTDLSILTVEDVGNVLKCLNMHDYVKLFKDEMIDGAILKDLDLETFKALKVDLFHAKKLLKFIGGWRPLK